MSNPEKDTAMAEESLKDSSMQADQIEQTEQAEPEIPMPQKPVIVVIVRNSFSADIEFQRIATETLNPTKEDIMAALEEQGVKAGIKEGLISRLCMRPVFSQPIEIATGLSAKTGTDGYLKYLIRTEKDMKPKVREDGTTDYRDLGYIQSVAKDQRLCEVHHATKGDDGYDIYGAVLEGYLGKEPIIPSGKNTRYDTEESVVISDVDGHVEMATDGMINVYDVLRINENIDNSTGNIKFIGDIIVSGNVASGFKVESTNGNIIVKGTVEGARLNAKEDITVNTGINGMNRARFVAGGNLKCKYIQNCTLEIGGDIYADSIMFCTIECGGIIELTGKKGTLIGGKAIIADGLIAKSIGTHSHVPTHVVMAGSGLKQNAIINGMIKGAKELEAEQVSLIQTITWCKELAQKGTLKPYQAKAFEQARNRLIAIQTEREERKLELAEAQKELLNMSNDSFIKCTGNIHTNVSITFGMQTMPVKSSFVNSRVFLLKGEITVSPL